MNETIITYDAATTTWHAKTKCGSWTGSNRSLRNLVKTILRRDAMTTIRVRANGRWHKVRCERDAVKLSAAMK